MARVLALIPDLLFGSNLQGALRAGGHEVRLVGDDAAVRAHLSGADVFVVDLVNEEPDGCAIVTALGRAGELGGVRTLGFYAHVDLDKKDRAEAAGFDLVVPRSRLARDGAALVEQLAGG